MSAKLKLRCQPPVKSLVSYRKKKEMLPNPDLLGSMAEVVAENCRTRRAAAALLASGLLVALCVSTGRDRLSVGIEALQRPGHPSVVQQSLSSILGVDSQGRRAIKSLIRKTEQSWQVIVDPTHAK